MQEIAWRFVFNTTTHPKQTPILQRLAAYKQNYAFQNSALAPFCSFSIYNLTQKIIAQCSFCCIVEHSHTTHFISIGNNEKLYLLIPLSHTWSVPH